MAVSRRTRRKEMKKNAVAVLIIAVFAVAVFSINSIGKFIAEKVITPVVSFSGIKTENQSITDIKTDKIELFALVSGSYANLEEAQKNVGGKYIFKLEDKFNVLHSIKANKDDAQKLATDSNGAVISLSLEEVSIKVTGTKAQTDLIASCFKFMTDCLKALPETEAKLIAGTLSPLQAESKIKAMKTDVSSKITALNNLNSSNTTVCTLYDILNVWDTVFNSVPSSSDENFLEKIRYISCAITCEYFNFLLELE